MRITVFDTETTGLNHNRHEIIELAYVSYDCSDYGDRYVHDKFESKVKPQNIQNAEPEALAVNGYQENSWKNAPDFKEIHEVVCKAFEESDLLLGQNLIFDLRFFKQMCKRDNLPVPNFPPYLDSKAVADRLVKEGWLERSSMDYLCEHYKIESNGRAHTALVDCERTIKVWDKLINDIGDEYEIYTLDRPYNRRRR